LEVNVKKNIFISIIFFFLFWAGTSCAQGYSIIAGARHIVRVKGNTISVFDRRDDTKEMYKESFRLCTIKNVMYHDGLLWVFLGKNAFRWEFLSIIDIEERRRFSSFEFQNEIFYKKQHKKTLHVSMKNGLFHLFYEGGKVFSYKFKHTVVYSKYDEQQGHLYIGLANGEFYCLEALSWTPYIEIMRLGRPLSHAKSNAFFKFHSPVVYTNCVGQKKFIALKSNEFYIFQGQQLLSRYAPDCKIVRVRPFLDAGLMVLGAQDCKMHVFDVANKDEHGNSKQICCHQFDHEIDCIVLDKTYKRFLSVSLKNNMFYVFDMQQEGQPVLHYQLESPLSTITIKDGFCCVGLKDDQFYIFDFPLTYKKTVLQDDIKSLAPKQCYQFDSKVTDLRVKKIEDKRFLIAVTEKNTLYIFDRNNSDVPIFEFQFSFSASEFFQSTFIWEKGILCCLKNDMICVVDVLSDNMQKRCFSYQLARNEGNLSIKYQNEMIIVRTGRQTYIFDVSCDDWSHARMIFNERLPNKVRYARYNSPYLYIALKDGNEYRCVLYRQADHGMERFFTFRGRLYSIMYMNYHDGLAYLCSQSKRSHRVQIYNIALRKWLFDRFFRVPSIFKGPICSCTFNGRAAAVGFANGQCCVLDPLGKRKKYRMLLGDTIDDMKFEDDYLKVKLQHDDCPYVFDVSDAIQQRCDKDKGYSDRKVFRQKVLEKKKDHQDKVAYLLQDYEKRNEDVVLDVDGNVIVQQDNKTKLYKPWFIMQ